MAAAKAHGTTFEEASEFSRAAKKKGSQSQAVSQDNHVDRVANGILIIACTANAGAAASIEAM